MADFAAFRVNNAHSALPGSEVRLILRRDVLTGEVKLYLSNAPAETELTTLVRISGMRRPIEICFEDGKQVLSMGDYKMCSRIPLPLSFRIVDMVNGSHHLSSS